MKTGSDRRPDPAKGIPVNTVVTDRFAMDYFCFGQGQKPFVILPGVSVQSVMLSREFVATAYRKMTEDYTVYVLDRRKNMPEGYDVYAMARDTAEAIRALKLENVSIFGASQGGEMAMEIAIRNPDLFEKMILGSATARLTGERSQPIRRWISLAESGNARDLCLDFGETIYSPSYFEQIRKSMIVLSEQVTAGDLARFAAMLRGNIGFDVTQELHKVRCPVLILGDTCDRVFGGESSEEILKCLGEGSNAQLYMYDGYGHAVYDTAPDYLDRILRFLLKSDA